MAGDSALLGSGEYRSLSDIRALAPGRFDRSSQTQLFDRFDWLETLHDSCLDGRVPHVVRANIANAEAWLFLVDAGARRKQALANWYSFAFRPIFVGSPDAAARRDLIETIARRLWQECGQVELYPVLADDGTSALLLTAFRKAGWLAVARPMGINHYLDVQGRDFETYWAGRPGTLRNTVRRKIRSAPFTYDLHSGFSEALWNDYVAVYRRSWKQDEPDYRFLRAIAQQEGAAGTLRLGFARIEGRPVAAQLWTVECGVALIHKLAHDRAADALSPGTLLSQYMFRHAIDTDRVQRIDYGTGDNVYKTEWMESSRPLYRIDCFNPRFMRSWWPAARTMISKLVG